MNKWGVHSVKRWVVESGGEFLSEEDCVPICAMCTSSGTEEQVLSRALLISAAPDLLEVCEAIERFDCPLGAGLLQQLRLAILKAKLGDLAR